MARVPAQALRSAHGGQADRVHLEVAPAPFSPPPLPHDEAARLRALHAFDILDTLPEPAYDDIVLLAAQICDAPIAAVTLVDGARQWFKARLGIDEPETPRDVSFCGHAIAAADPVFVVEDAREDPRFRGNPSVLGEPHIRFYAGAVIRAPGGEALGTVCVSDSRARTFAAGQRTALQALARQTGALLDMRLRHRAGERQAIELERVTAEARVERRRSAEMLERVLRGGQLGLWDLDVPSGRFVATPRAFEIVGLGPESAGVSFDWRARVHPADWPALDAAIKDHLRGATDHYVCEHRMRHAAGHWVWVLANAVIVERDADGRPVRIVGTHMDISARVESQQTLQRLAQSLRRTGAMARVGGWDLDLPTGKVSWTDEVYRMHEVDESVDLTLIDCYAYFPLPGRLALQALVKQAIVHGDDFDLELPFVTATGRRLHVRVHGEAERADGVTVRLSGTIQDITAQKSAEQAALESERRLRLIADQMPALIAYVDAGQRYRFVNAHMKRVLGTDIDQAIGRTLREVRGDAAYEGLRPHVEATLRGEKVGFAYDIEALGRPLRLQATFIPDVEAGGEVRGFYAMTIDITELHRTQRLLEELARIDVLTGLPNRRLFDERLAEAVLRAQRSGRPLALMFLDVDRFKSINDTLGHAGGDAVLCEFARRLQRCMRNTDLVARVGGDEFIVVCEGAGDGASATVLVQKILECIRVPFELPGGPVQVATSVGIAVGRPDECHPAVLLARADRALYQAKQNGRDGYAIDLN